VGWAAVVPACWAVAGLLWRPGSIEGAITRSGIRISDPETEIPFEPGVRLSAHARNVRKPRKPFAIHLVHGSKSVTIPSRLDMPSEQVFQAILKGLPPQGSEKVAPFLAEYYSRQIAMFGPELIFSAYAFVARGKERGSGMRLRAWSLATIVAGLVYAVAAAFTPENARFHSEFIGFGSLLIVTGLLSFALSFVIGGRSVLGIRHWGNSCVVIGPVGLALVQGDIQGELTWNQLLDVAYRPRSVNFQLDHNSSPAAGIVLKVPGAQITIADIYDRPLDLIHERILRNWRHEFDDPE
jgi:hypothetical protein